MLKYENSENINTDSVDTVVFNLYRIKHRKFFGGTPGRNFQSCCIEYEIVTKRNPYFLTSNELI